MKKMTSMFLAAIFAASAVAIGAEQPKQNPEILKSYLSIQEQLAIDSLKDVSSSASEISKLSQNEKLKTSALTLSKDADLKTARKHFKALSAEMDAWAKKEKPPGIDRVSCSMAKATWLQKHGPIMNPYYGKDMQDCGEILE